MENNKLKRINIQIVTPYELFYKGEIDKLVVPSTDGETGIWPGHTPVIIAINPGELRMIRDDEKMSAAVSYGYAEIEFDRAVVVVSSAEWPEGIDVERAKSALERAEKRLKDPLVSPRELERTKRSVMRAKTRLKIAGKSTGDRIDVL